MTTKFVCLIMDKIEKIDKNGKGKGSRIMWYNVFAVIQ